MKLILSAEFLQKQGLSREEAIHFIQTINMTIHSCLTEEEAWQKISKEVFMLNHPFSIHLYLFNLLFKEWQDHPETAPAWIPTKDTIKNTNIFRWMSELNMLDIKKFHAWSVQCYKDFWAEIVKKLNIQFKKQPDSLCDLTQGIESPQWFKGARMNIADSCFTASPSLPAILYRDEENNIHQLSYGELHLLSNRIANSLLALNIKSGDAIAIAMPMNQYAVAIYLGIIKMGAVVVSIADSFSSQEIAVRLQIANTKLIFTQDVIIRENKQLPLYEKIKNASSNPVIVLTNPYSSIFIQEHDLSFDGFLIDHTEFNSAPCDPMSTCNILFSSGTTASPKAIPWNHTTPIKAASDAYLHHNIQTADVLAWPTNLGWMMGPWLIFAALMNHATIALYTDAPKDRTFGEFIERTKVTMLGVVPTLVASWRQSKCMEGLDLTSIKLFSSTGECSNPEDMLYLASLAHYQPIIEYCGGTEIGGAYITSTVIEKNYPSLLSTPAMGLDFVLIDENKNETDMGEVAIIPPSIGLSVHLLNANHHEVYYAEMPTIKKHLLLRRHGDQIRRLSNGYYYFLGRLDDSINFS